MEEELGKLGKVGRPRSGTLGSMLISFVYGGRVCRKLCPTVLNSAARKSALIHTRPLRGGQFQSDDRCLARKNRRRKRNNFQKAKLLKIEVQNLEPSTLQLVANDLRKDFLGNSCSLLGLKARALQFQHPVQGF